MKITIESIAHHRNGICGAPFDVLLFNDGESRKLGILFEDKGQCAVLDVSKLSAGDIAFSSNSWRGDHYEPSLRAEISARSDAETQKPTMPTMSNENRAAKCDKAIASYGDDLLESNLIDFLTDAMHWCDHNGEDFHIALAQACRHYIHELNGDQQDERRLS